MAGRPSRIQIYQRLDEAFTEVRDRLGGLPDPVEAEGIWNSIWYEEAHHSTALEGNTLVMKEVEALLEQGRAVGDKELKDYMEVRGYATAAKWVYNQGLDPGNWTSGSLLTMAEIRHVHSMAMKPVWDVAPHPSATHRESPGSFREHDIHPFPAGMSPPPWPDVHSQVDTWLNTLQSITDAEYPVEALAASHSRFEQIHPFLDGNGRTGRLLLNLVFVRLGYAPAIIYKRDRTKYLKGLQASDNGDHGPLGELLARAALDNLYRFIVPAIAGPRRLVPLAALADNDLSETALRVAATRGRLRAQKSAGGRWRSSRVWVDEYRASRHQRN